MSRALPITATACAMVAWLGLALPAANAGRIVTLRPLDPQPRADEIAPGLRVVYSYPPAARTLVEAKVWHLDHDAKAGPPLPGLTYPATGPGETALTSGRAEGVAAQILGYLYFPVAGRYGLDLHVSDGIKLRLGHMLVFKQDGLNECRSTGARFALVPEPGWYQIGAFYFQAVESACLELRWQRPDGTVETVPAEAYGHTRRTD